MPAAAGSRKPPATCTMPLAATMSLRVSGTPAIRTRVPSTVAGSVAPSTVVTSPPPSCTRPAAVTRPFSTCERSRSVAASRSAARRARSSGPTAATASASGTTKVIGPREVSTDVSAAATRSMNGANCGSSPTSSSTSLRADGGPCVVEVRRGAASSPSLQAVDTSAVPSRPGATATATATVAAVVRTRGT